MTMTLLTIEGLFLLLAILAETMDLWTLGGRPGPPQRAFPCCFVD